MNRTHIARSATLLVALACTAVPATAQDVQVRIEGEIQFPILPLPPPLDGTMAGDPFSVTFCFDPTTPDSDPGVQVGTYPGTLSQVKVEIGGIAVVSPLSHPPLNQIRLEDDLPLGIFGSLQDRLELIFDFPDGSEAHVSIAESDTSFLTSDDLPACGDLPAQILASEATLTVATPAPGFVYLIPQTLECGACVAPECFLVIGDPRSPGEPFAPDGHAFTTQVGAVQQWWPVLLDDIPEFVIADPPQTARTPLHGLAGLAAGGTVGLPVPAPGPGVSLPAPLTPSGPPEVFAVQVLMWNPQVFPSNPEQFTQALAVRVWPDGTVVTVPYGTADGGLEIWAQTGWNAQGQKVLSFPFSIPGF